MGSLIEERLTGRYEPFCGEGVAGRLPPIPITQYPGWNVVAGLPGESTDLILVGAHLDVAHETVEGAKDDGSGVACVLELARVLAARPRKCGYLFVLFDGEEIGLRGSYAYAAAHRRLPIRHVLILDTVGQRGDGSLYASHIVSYRGAGNSGALGLLRAAAEAEAEGEGMVFVLPLSGFRGVPLVAKLVLDRAMGLPGMDTGAFQGRADTVVGVSTGGEHSSRTHTPDDRVEYMDPAVLERVGRVAERYVTALEDGLLPSGGQRLYVPARSPHAGVGVLADRAAWYVFAAALFSVALALAICLVRAKPGLQAVGAILRAEAPLMAILAVVPFALTALVSLLSFLPTVVYLGVCVLWIPVCFAIVTLVRRGRTGLAHGPAAEGQKVLLACLSLTVGVAWLAARGPFAALLVALPVVLAVTGAGFKTKPGRVVSRVTVVVAAVYALVAGTVLAATGLLDRGMVGFAPLFGLTLLTPTVGAYGFSWSRPGLAREPRAAR